MTSGRIVKLLDRASNEPAALDLDAWLGIFVQLINVMLSIAGLP